MSTTVPTHRQRLRHRRPRPVVRIVSDIAASLACEANLEEVLRRFLSTLIRVSDAEAATVRLLSADGKHLRLVGAIGLPEEVIQEEKYVPIACGICGAAAKDNTIHQSSDMKRCAERKTLGFFGSRCQRIIAVPLHAQGRILGVYNLFLRDVEPPPKTLYELFDSISEHLGMALENARLTKENMRATLMNERQLLANEIHDSVVQTLAYAKMRISLLQEAIAKRDDLRTNRYLGEVGTALDSAYSDLRTLIRNFRNRMDPRGLIPALQHMTQAFPGRTGIGLSFQNLVPEINLTPDQEVQVFHIVQEALNNVAKHSGAQQALLLIDMDQGRYRIRVEDDGRSGALPLLANNSDQSSRFPEEGEENHFGLTIMQERASQIGGQITLKALAAGGTRLELLFPSRG